MADILKYRKLDGTEVEVANNSTIALGHTEASIEFTVDLDLVAVLEGETRGWFGSVGSTTSAPQQSGVYGFSISLSQGQTQSVTITTVDAKSTLLLSQSIFSRFTDIFNITVSRATAPTDSTTDSTGPNFLVYPDSDAALAIVNATFALTDSATTFGIVDSDYVHLRQNRDFDFLTNLPKTIDSAGITRSLFDSDVRKSISSVDAGGDGSLTYNNATGVITYTGPSASEVRAHFGASQDLAYDASTGIFSIDVEVKYTKDNFDSDLRDRLTTTNTDSIAEGSNLYFTTQRARNTINVADLGGDGSLTYDSAKGKLSYTGPLSSEVRAHFTGDKGIVYNNGSGVINIDSGNIRGMFSASGDLTYNSATGQFSFDVEQVYTKANFDSDLGDANTGQLPEGTNLYYTTARADSAFDASFALASTDSLSEGNANLYYTTARADSAARSALIAIDAGGDGSFAYDSATGKFTYTGPSATEVRSHFSAQGDLTYDSSTGVFQFDVEQVYTKANFDSDFNVAIDSATTSDLSEGSNLYYTPARVDSDFDASFALASTDSLSEGSTNLYFTNERVDDRVSALITGGVNVTATYDDAAGTLEIKVPFENIDDRVGNILTAGSGININYDDPNATITIANTLNTSDFTDSAFVTGLPVSTFTNDKNYLDSTYAAALIDSAHIKAVVDSAYVQLIQADLQRDSSFISSIVTGGTLNMGANNIITTGKVLFANVYSQLSDLPSASTYHGMFAHVHGTGKAYYAHAGAWIELANNSQLSNSANWNTAFGWGDHAAAGYQLAATALDSTKTLQLVDSDVILSKLHPNSFGKDSAVKLYYNNVKKFETTDSGAKITGDLTLETASATIRLGNLILQDSDGQLKIADSAGITTTIIRNVLDSALITQLIDGPYIQARQTLLDSDLALQLLLDSSEIIDLIDSAYINARVSSVDSGTTLALIDSAHVQSKIPHAYVQSRQQKYNTSDFTDSAFVTGLPVSTFTNDVQYLDSTTVQGVISASYIQSNQNDYLDSTLTAQLIDSAYIALRTTTGTDSATVIGLIDSNYIASRTIAVAQPQFVNYKYNADGNQTEFGGGVVDVNGQTVSLSPGNFSVFLNGIKLLDSDFTANTSTNVVTLSSGATLNDELVIQTIIGQNAVAGVSAVDSSYVQLRVPQTYLSTIIDSDYVTARSGVVLDSASIASGVIVSTVDEAYVQARQQKYNTNDFTDSAFVTGLPISTFTNDANYLDSTTITGVVNNAYVQSRQISYNTSDFTDSAFVTGLPISTFTNDKNYLDSTTITGVINNAYVRARQALIDSDLTKLLVDSAYIQLRDRFQDSSLVTSTVDSSYVQLKVPASYIQSKQTNFLDSSLTSQLIDSAYIALRTTAGTDSATVIGLIDSDYVAARVTGVVTPQFTDFRYKADSGQTLFSGADLGGTSLNLRTDNFNVFLNGVKLIDSDFTANISNNTITLTEGADSGDDLVITTIEGDIVDTTNVVDSAYVQARQEGVNATFKDYKFVATANQTVFSGNDANGTALSFETNKFHVLLNGIRLDASDFTESADNNKITLATGAAVSDELIVSTIGTEKTTTLASITSTVDSAYVQARQADLQRDSAFITGLVDSALIEPLLSPIHISGDVVMIGRTSSSSATAGAQFSADGSNIVRDGQSALTVKRLTSNGDIITLAKDGDAVGTIGGIKTSSGGRTYLSGSTTHSIYVNGGSANVNPGTATGSDNDNAIDLGASYARWKNLYLSGGVYLGGTGSSNNLDDYEEGSFTPTLSWYTPSNGSVSYQARTAYYIKVGRAVTVHLEIRLNIVSQNSATLPVLIDGFPFPFRNTGGYGGSLMQVSLQGFTFSSGHIPYGWGEYNSTRMFLLTMSSGNLNSNLPTPANYKTINVSGTYITPT